jgi:flagellar FliJ protein
VQKFKFRFQSVENVKKREEGLKQERLAEVNRTLQDHETALAGLHGLREACQRQITERTTAGRLNAAEIALSHLYLQKVSGDIQRQRAQVARAQQEVEVRRETLVQTARERKMFENLRTRDQAAHLYEQARQEQARMDEIAGRPKQPPASGGQQ